MTSNSVPPGTYGNLSPSQMRQQTKKTSKLVIEHSYETEREVFLTESTEDLMAELSEEWACRQLLIENNLNVRNKFLFHGPSGNGKTTITRKLAKVMGIPIFEVNTALVIDSHLGQTGTNIQEVFSYLDSPCILMWDEIDSIIQTRGSTDRSGASMERDNSVNTFLINMEKMSSNIIFIGLTNRLDTLDPAALRRFDIKHEIPLPDEAAMRHYATTFLPSNKIKVKAPAEIIDHVVNNCQSYAEMEQELLKYARMTIIQANRKPDQQLFK